MVMFRYLSLACLSVLVLAFPTSRPAVASVQAEHARAIARPLLFEPNRGQAAAQARFVARTGGAVLMLTESEAVLRLTGQAAEASKRQAAAVSLRFVGGAAHPRLRALDLQSARSNYFKGPRRGWLTDLPLYARIGYQAVYPGIDVIFYGHDGRLEYDFLVAPGANPAAIALAFDGVSGSRLNDDGDLVLTTSAGDLVFRAPQAYQRIAGERRAVGSRYAIENGRVSIRLAEYDATRPLIIDPALTYSSYLGGSGADAGNAITTDDSGNMYLTGQTMSLDFPLGTGAVQADKAGGTADTDVFVAKFDAGGLLVYSTYLGSGGSPGDDVGQGIAVDTNGRAYVTGFAGTGSAGLGTAFPTTGSNSCDHTGQDVFVAVLDASGSSLAYSSCFGGGQGDKGNAIAIDSAGSLIYVTGITAAGAPALPSARNSHHGGFYDAFLMKLTQSAGGYSLSYSTYIGGTGADEGNDVYVDGTGAAYIVGLTNSSDIGLAATDPVPVGSLQGSSDMFVAKVAASGSALSYIAYIGGSRSEGLVGEHNNRNGIAVDSSGNAYIAGQTEILVGQNPDQTEITDTDALIAKLSANGAVAWSKAIGGSGPDEGRDLARASTGDLFLIGTTASADLDGADAVPGNDYSAAGDAYVTRLDASGQVLYSVYLGGTLADAGNGIAMDSVGNAYLTGVTYSGDFPLYPSAPFQDTNRGDQDAFLARIGPYADLALTITGSTDAATDTFLYTINVKNWGPDPATGVNVIVEWPSTAVLQKITWEQGDCTPPASPVNQLVCYLGTMAAGAKLKITAQKAGATDSGINRAIASSDDFDPIVSNNSLNWPGTPPDSEVPTLIITDPGTSSPPPGDGGGGGGGGALGFWALLALGLRLSLRSRPTGKAGRQGVPGFHKSLLRKK